MRNAVDIPAVHNPDGLGLVINQGNSSGSSQQPLDGKCWEASARRCLLSCATPMGYTAYEICSCAVIMGERKEVMGGWMGGPTLSI